MEKSNHNIYMESRCLLDISGVKDVKTYNDEEIEILTDDGLLTITGNEFNVIKLDVETGEMKVSGRIDSIYYTDNGPKQSGGILSRLFK